MDKKRVRQKPRKGNVVPALQSKESSERGDSAILPIVGVSASARGLEAADEELISEQEIRAARDYAEAVIRTTTTPFVVLHADLRVNTVNAAFYRTFRTNREQTEGFLIFDLAGGAWNVPKLRSFLEDILPRNSFFSEFEITHDFPGIGQRTMLLDARQLDLADGAPRMILLAIEDVTERLRADITTASLAAIVDSSDDAIIGKDLNGVIRSWNKGAERLFGYTAREAIGQSIMMLIPLERLREEPEILERLKRGERVDHFETVRLRKDGSRLEISLTISPIRDRSGRVVGASKIARDITERKRIEEALAESHTELQAHARELARFNQAAVDRELRMIELKQEINELCRQYGETARYPLAFQQEEKDAVS